MIFSSAIFFFLNYLRSYTGITQVALQANLFRLVRTRSVRVRIYLGTKITQTGRSAKFICSPQKYGFSAKAREQIAVRPLPSLFEKLQTECLWHTGAFARIEVYGKRDQIPAGMPHFEKRRPLSRCVENQFLHVFRQCRMR